MSEQNANLPAKMTAGAIVASQANTYNLNGAQDELGVSLSRYTLQHKPVGTLAAGKITMDGLVQADKVTFVWLAMSCERAYLDAYRPTLKKQRLLCASRNGKTPDRGEAMQAGPCETCPLAAWHDSEKPECSLIFKLACWDVDNDVPFVFSVKRTGIKALRSINTRIKAKYCNATGLGQRAVKIELSAKQVDQNHCIPVFQLAGELEADKVAFYDEIAAGFVSSLQAVEADEDEVPPIVVEQSHTKPPAAVVVEPLTEDELTEANVATWEEFLVPDHWLPEALRGCGMTYRDAAKHDNALQYKEPNAKSADGFDWRTARYYMARYWSTDLEHHNRIRIANILRLRYPDPAKVQAVAEKAEKAAAKKAKKQD